MLFLRKRGRKEEFVKYLDKEIIANPRVFEIGKPSELAKRIIRESKGIKVGISELDKLNEQKR